MLFSVGEIFSAECLNISIFIPLCSKGFDNYPKSNFLTVDYNKNRTCFKKIKCYQ